jgi:hypothetical protein
LEISDGKALEGLGSYLTIFWESLMGARRTSHGLNEIKHGSSVDFLFSLCLLVFDIFLWAFDLIYVNDMSNLFTHILRFFYLLGKSLFCI